MRKMINFLSHRLPTTKIKIICARLLYLLTTTFLGKKARIILRNGIRYEVDLSEGIDLSLFLFGNFQKHTTKNRFFSLSKDAVVFDIGANFGTMTLPYAKSVPDGMVYAFEPTHYALGKLRKNLKLNPDIKNRVKIINMFVSKKSEVKPKIKAFSSWKVNVNTDKNVHPVHWGSEKSASGVKSTTLDEFCDKNKVKKVDLIKIDTDGHEPEVLEGARKTIDKFRPVIIFEAGEYPLRNKGITSRFYLNFFQKINYSLFSLQHKEKITTANHRSLIPLLGTIDIISVPQKYPIIKNT